MYGLHDFGLMLGDRVRTDAYIRALRQSVTPGCTVLEIGAGTGLFAMLARRWGAERVYAIEVLDAIDLAPAIARANALEGIEFIKGFSTRVEIPVRADVLVSDLRGTLPLHGLHIPSIIDARDRLLAPGGTQIPQCDRIRGAVVEAPAMYRSLHGPWETGRFDIDHSVVREINSNLWRRWDRGDMGDARSLTSPAHWATIDYTSVTGPHFSGVMEWTVEQDGTAHGLSLWFDATLLPGIGYSSAPDGPGLVYGNAFFPLREPVSVREGDSITCLLRADLIEGRYVWTWKSEIRAGQATPVAWVQSTFYGQPLNDRDVAVQESGYAPRLGGEGGLVRATLELMDGSRTLEVIAAELEKTFPDRFGAWDSAIAWVRQLSREYTT
jgi:protein arginine N-methyltransferase 1